MTVMMVLRKNIGISRPKMAFCFSCGVIVISTVSIYRKLQIVRIYTRFRATKRSIINALLMHMQATL